MEFCPLRRHAPKDVHQDQQDPPELFDPSSVLIAWPPSTVARDYKDFCYCNSNGRGCGSGENSIPEHRTEWEIQFPT